MTEEEGVIEDGADPLAEYGIRDLTEGDLPWVAEWERVVFGPAAWSAALIEHDFAHGARRYRGIERAARLEGYAVYGFDGDAFTLMNLAVIPEARGEGLGRALLDDFLREGENLGLAEAWLEVAVTNEAAISLYRSAAFEDVRIRPRYYQPEGIDAMVMRIRLPRALPV